VLNLGQLGAEDARETVRAAARRERHDEAHRPRGKVLAVSGSRGRTKGKGEREKGKGQKPKKLCR